MPERTVTLRLKAVTDQYKRAMNDASAATGGLITKAGGIEKLGGQMQRVGGTLTRSVTLPLALAGAGAVKLSLDFEKAFSRMVGLAGVSSDEIDGLKDSVLALAGETTRPPQELAEALYFIRSAGLDGQDALDALEFSAKAAAAGLGDTVTVADAVTSAMNAYGSEVLSASEATDVLAATAEQGKVEASALAGQFGRLLPVSSELGVTFDQVGGAMGFLTRTSGSAELAATQLNGVLSKMVEPGQRGRDTLEQIGMSMDELRASVRERGLLETLQDLRTRLEENGLEFSAFAEDQQFIQGALGLTGAKFEEAAETIDAVGNSAGKTDEAFAAFAETAGFKNAKAFADLQAALIKVGDALVPLIAKGAELASVFLDLFNTLPGPLQSAVIGFVALLAVTGPVVSIAGTLMANWTLLSAAFDKAAISAYNASGALTKLSVSAAPLAAVAAAVAAVGIAVKRTSDEMGEASSDAEAMARRFTEGFDASAASADEFNARYNELAKAHNEFARASQDAANPLLKRRHAETADAIAEEVQAMDDLAAKTNELMETQGLSADEALRLATNTDIVAGATDEATGEFDAAAAALAGEEEQIQATVDAFNELADSLRAQFDPLFAAQDASLKLAEAQWKATEAAKAHGAESREAAEANREVLRAQVDLEAQMYRLKGAIEAGDVSMSDAVATLDRWVAEGALTEEQARQAKEELGWMALAADNLENRSIAIPVSADMSAFHANIAAAMNAIGSAAIHVTGTNIHMRASGGPVHAGGTYLVGEDGPELLQIGATSGYVTDAGTTSQLMRGPAMSAMAHSGGGMSLDYDRLGAVFRKAVSQQPITVKFGERAVAEVLRSYERSLR